jgi:hypothetical protein
VGDKRVPGEGNRGRRRWLAGLFWVMFGAGVLVQVFAPRLKIEHNAFVIPPSLLSAGKQINPAEIVARERQMQMLSAGLTAGGAIGLGFYYRRAFFKGPSAVK